MTQMGWSRYVHGTRQFVATRACPTDTEASLAMAARASSRLLRGEDERLVVNQELYLPARPLRGIGRDRARAQLLVLHELQGGLAPGQDAAQGLHPGGGALVASRAQGRTWGPASSRGRRRARRQGPRGHAGGRRRGLALDLKSCSSTRGHRGRHRRAREARAESRIRVLLTAPGAKFNWSGVKRVEFKADGSVRTPWGEGTWGVLAGEAGEGQVWADFVGAHHVLSRQARR